MKLMKTFFYRARGPFLTALLAVLLIGCRSMECCEPAATEASASSTPASSTAAVMVAPTPVAPAVTSEETRPTIRIRAGGIGAYTDSNGNVWAADQGFEEGETTDRAEDLAIANTKDPKIYRSERYSMKSFSQKLPNGKYIVKLHFAETFEGISGPGERVFSFNVEGREFKDFDIWVKAGGGQKAYIETVETGITDGKLDITFTPNVENPAINGIEILPVS